jgi:hypothetical protein
LPEFGGTGWIPATIDGIQPVPESGQYDRNPAVLCQIPAKQTEILPVNDEILSPKVFCRWYFFI